MFTGIVTDIGEVIALEKKGDLRARIATSYPVDGIDIGASIACDGVCLTVVALGTSAPELVVCVVSSVKGTDGITLGNIVGSNIFNLLLVLGIASLLQAQAPEPRMLEIDFPLMTALAAAVQAEGLTPSPKIYNLLQHYRTLVPADNAAYRDLMSTDPATGETIGSLNSACLRAAKRCTGCSATPRPAPAWPGRPRAGSSR